MNKKTYKVTVIASDAFKGNTKLTSVTIGKNITRIKSKAFKDCSKLGKITIKSTKLTFIDTTAFKGIKSTVKITVPSSKYSAYKKMLLKAGVSSKAKITK